MNMEDNVFWILILAGAGIILWMISGLADIDMTTGVASSLLLFAAAQVVLWKKMMLE